MSTRGRILLLDVHGVILTNPFMPFLAELAQRHGRDRAGVLDMWTNQLRRPFWLGQLSEEGMWRALFPGADGAALTEELDRRYAAGPLFSALDAINEPIWLLSNHRSDWLHRRLVRFGLADRFDRVFVSDVIGFVKPDAGAFELVQREADTREVTFVDDKPVNVAAAAGILAEVLLVGDADRLTHPSVLDLGPSPV